MKESKDLIAEKALELFAAKGYEGVGIQEICEASGITKPTLYYYFKSKSGLFSYLLETKGGDFFSCIKEALVYEHDFIKSLTKALCAEIDFAGREKSFFTLFAALQNSPDGSEEHELSLSLVKNVDSAFYSFFKSSSAEFGNMRGKEKLYAKLFQSNVFNCAMMSLSKKMKFDDQTIYQVIHSFVYGVAN